MSQRTLEEAKQMIYDIPDVDDKMKRMAYRGMKEKRQEPEKTRKPWTSIEEWLETEE